MDVLDTSRPVGLDLVGVELDIVDTSTSREGRPDTFYHDRFDWLWFLLYFYVEEGRRPRVKNVTLKL